MATQVPPAPPADRLADRLAGASDYGLRHLSTCRSVLPPRMLAALDVEAKRRAGAAENPAEVNGAPAPDIIADVTAPGRWTFRGATDAGRDYVAALGVVGGGGLGLPPTIGERFIAGARAAGLTLGMAPSPVATGEPKPATMPRIERAAAVAEVAR